MTSSEDINNSAYERTSHGHSDVDLNDVSTLNGTEVNFDEVVDDPRIDQARHDLQLSDMEAIRHSLMLFNLAPPLLSTESELLEGAPPQQPSPSFKLI